VDPDPGGPKTCGSGGSGFVSGGSGFGSGTLLRTNPNVGHYRNGLPDFLPALQYIKQGNNTSADLNK